MELVAACVSIHSVFASNVKFKPTKHNCDCVLAKNMKNNVNYSQKIIQCIHT